MSVQQNRRSEVGVTVESTIPTALRVSLQTQLRLIMMNAVAFCPTGATTLTT